MTATTVSDMAADSSSSSSTETLENLVVVTSPSTPSPAPEDEAASSSSSEDQETTPMITVQNEEGPVKQDYRLDFTEVEGTLEEIPENATVMMKPVEAEASIAPPQYASFHIPESNVSDIAASEFSDNTSSVQAGFHIRSEPLTAKQQVALWLTRTSMSDLSSMPSLRSLVFPNRSHKDRDHDIQRSFRPTTTSTGEKKPRRSGKAEIRRNFSTKSLLNGVGCSFASAAGRDQELLTPTPIRKCETVIALSGCPSERSRAAAAGGDGAMAQPRSRRSSLNLFKRLARRGERSTSSRQQQQQQGLHQNNHASTTSGLRTPRGGGFGGGFSMTSEMSGCESPFSRGLRPVNRLRSSSSMICSHCASVSFNNSRMTSRAPSQISLLLARRASTNTGDAVALSSSAPHSATMPNMMASSSSSQQPVDLSCCKICLDEMPSADMAKLSECGCLFCKECMDSYISLEVSEVAYDISCPDPMCERKGVLQIPEMEAIVGKDVMDRHRANRLNTEVALDANRAWCPRPDCETICHVCDPADAGNKDSGASAQCPSCAKEFCGKCSANWHPGDTCAQYGQKLVAQSLKAGGSAHNGFGFGDILNLDKLEGDIKPCPMCHVPIERDAGCAQMMCKRCKHVFCWYCQTSLDDDFLLRHYDQGECEGRLGHSRVSVLWHRAQVIGIFAGFGILLLVASPILLLAAPCILCCRCKILERLETESGKSRARTRAAAAAATGGEDEVVEKAQSVVE